MKPAQKPSQAIAVAFVALFVAMTVSGQVTPPAKATAASASFSITNVNWGTGATSLEVGPGSINVPLVVSAQYLGSTQAKWIQGILGTLPVGVVAASGSGAPTASAVSVPSASAFQLTFYLTISQTASLGTFPVSVELDWNTTAQSKSGYSVELDSFNIKILGTVQMSASSSQSSLSAGEVNNVTITLTNRGTGAASQISPSVSSSLGSVLNVQPVIQSLLGGSSTNLLARVYVPASSAGAAVTLTVTTAYTDSYGASLSSTLPIGFYAVTVPEPTLTFTATGGSLSPGQINDVTITLTNSGPGTATTLKTAVTAPSGFSVLNQFPQVASLAAGSSVNATLRVFVPASAAGSASSLTFAVSFVDPYGYSQSTTQTLGLFTASSVAIAAATSLSVSTVVSSLTAGQKSPVSFLIKNTGQQPVYAPTISLTTTSPLVVSANSTLTLANAVINPGSSLTYSAEVTTGTGSTGGFYAGTLTITYNDQFGDSHTQTVPVAFVVTVPISQVSVSSLLNQVNVGKSTAVSFMISNSGTAPIYSPTFSLAAPSGLAVTTNATFSRSNLVLNPGQSVKYVANITTGPKTSEGAYLATLTVTYADQFGNTHSSSFSEGIVAVGGIQMIVQDLSTLVNGTAVSVSGTLLNEGIANAYYTSVTGTITSGSTVLATSTSYVGEVDSNTPLPLALDISIPANRLSLANGTATLTLLATYQNDFGTLLQFKTTQRVFLGGSSTTGRTTSTSNGGGSTVSTQTLDIIRYGALILIVVAAVVTVVYLRRGKSKAAKGSAKTDVY